MSNGRSMGAILMGLAVAAFAGSTCEILPPATFFPALALFAIGAFQFLRSSREALAEAERRTHEKLHPVIRADRSAAASAERQAMRRGAAQTAVSATAPARRPSAPRPSGPAAAPIELEEVVSDFEVTPDVSFPVEVQRGDALADQLRKLNVLLTQGILSEEEYAIAKAKLLG
jgi:hypothetical protein